MSEIIKISESRLRAELELAWYAGHEDNKNNDTEYLDRLLDVKIDQLKSCPTTSEHVMYGGIELSQRVITHLGKMYIIHIHKDEGSAWGVHFDDVRGIYGASDDSEEDAINDAVIALDDYLKEK